MPNYTLDPELKDLANDIIKNEPKLKHLEKIMIAYIFRPEAPVSNGKVTAGMCLRTDDRNRTIHEIDFIIEISKDVWDDATPQFKAALMEHELCHAGVRLDEQGEIIYDEKTGRPKTFIRPHDIEEFGYVLEKHGDYHEALRNFLVAFAKHKETKGKKQADAPTD